LGSTRPANLPDEAQLASARHAPITATLRAARTAESNRWIPIRPEYHFTGSHAHFEGNSGHFRI
jgi:hypothetical protein